MTPATTLQAYGFDSYPFHHLANRICQPYWRVMRVVEALRNGDAISEKEVGLRSGELITIIAVYADELKRQERGGEGGARQQIVARLDTIQRVRHMMPVEEELDPEDDEDILDPVGK